MTRTYRTSILAVFLCQKRDEQFTAPPNYQFYNFFWNNSDDDTSWILSKSYLVLIVWCEYCDGYRFTVGSKKHQNLLTNGAPKTFH